MSTFCDVIIDWIWGNLFDEDKIILKKGKWKNWMKNWFIFHVDKFYWNLKEILDLEWSKYENGFLNILKQFFKFLN